MLAKAGDFLTPHQRRLSINVATVDVLSRIVDDSMMTNCAVEMQYYHTYYLTDQDDRYHHLLQARPSESKLAVPS